LETLPRFGTLLQLCVRIDLPSILWQAMTAKLKTVHVTLTPQIAELLEAEVAAGRFANLSEAVRNAAWKAFAEDPAAELRAAFSQLDESPDEAAPDRAVIGAEIRAWRARR
jgi:Arc/MetJ-type ribon-helix-helix transcriptional regulator